MGEWSIQEWKVKRDGGERKRRGERKCGDVVKRKREEEEKA